MSDSPSDLQMDAVKRPRFGYTPRTQQYWRLKIRDAVDRLDIEARAVKARDRKKKYQEYDFTDQAGRKKQSINAISRLVGTFINNVVTDNPIVSPQFVQQEQEELWYDRIRAFVDQNIRSNDLKTILGQLCWDNAYADIGWLKIDWLTQFTEGTPVDPATQQQKKLQELGTIDQEHAAMFAGMPVPTKPDDWHALHLAEHGKELDQLEQRKQVLAQAQQMGLDAGSAIEQNDAQAALLGMHVGEHARANRRVDDERFEARRWPPYLVYYDPDAQRWEDADWYAVEVVDRLETIRERPDFRNTSQLQGVAGVDHDEFHEQRASGQWIDAGPVMGTKTTAPTERYIRYWIIHDRVADGIIVIAETESFDQKPMVAEEWPFEGDIVAPLVLNPVTDQVHGVPMIAKLDFVHDQLIRVNDKIAEVIEYTPAVKFFIERKMLTDTTKASMLNPKHLFVAVNQVPKEGILPWTWPGIDKNLLEERARLLNEMQLEAGIPEVYNAGETDESATATAIRDRQAGNKIGDAKSRVGRMVEWYCDRLLSTFRQHGTMEQLVRVVGELGIGWDRFPPEQIPEMVFWQVDSDSLAPSKREMEKKQLLELNATLQPYMGSIVTNPKPLIAATVRKFDVMEDPSVLFEMPEMQPMMMAAPGAPGGPAPGGATGPPPMSPMTQNGLQGNQEGAQQAQGVTA